MLALFWQKKQNMFKLIMRGKMKLDQRVYREARIDFDIVQQGFELVKESSTKKYYVSSVAKQCFQFILSPANTYILLWGTKTIQIDNHTITLP